MIILADTAVWIEHWRRRNDRVVQLLENKSLVVHPFVLGEIALGRISSRAAVLADLALLDSPTVAENSDVLGLIKRTPLWGRGIGWVDAHLLATAMLDHIQLWTLDQQLRTAAQELGVAF
ncbi:MAG TPA: PIN domain-containing protein [Gemmatimonadales bacterium]|nr:PIN domain-containing protein [Gemmatimonadales bacterium]